MLKQFRSIVRTPIFRSILYWLLWQWEFLWKYTSRIFIKVGLLPVSTTHFGFCLVRAWSSLVNWPYSVPLLENRLNPNIVIFAHFTEWVTSFKNKIVFSLIFQETWIYLYFLKMNNLLLYSNIFSQQIIKECLQELVSSALISVCWNWKRIYWSD